MPQGLEVFGPTGAKYISTTDRLGRVLGSISVNGNDGSIVDARFSQGQGFCMLIGGASGVRAYYPLFSISGNTLSWVYSAPPPNSSPGSDTVGQPPGFTQPKAPCTLLYGVY